MSQTKFGLNSTYFLDESYFIVQIQYEFIKNEFESNYTELN